MENPVNNSGTKIGTVGGTLLSIAANISSGDLLRTAILAAVGAIISFTVSVLLKLLLQRIKKK
jgi:mannitol-specific phosphotransferase system IIBC component